MSLSRKYKGLGEKGFTLVELAVVLIILGAIFMSVLKVESMVKNAKIRQVINQYREVRTAILVYKDKYGYLPGDDSLANVHVGSALLGNGDGKIDALERFYASEHISYAGLIKGKYTAAYIGTYPATPILHAFSLNPTTDYVLFNYASTFTFGTVLHTMNKNAIYFFNLPYDVAQAVDQALDDGDYRVGNVQSLYPYVTASGSVNVTYILFE